MVAPGQLSFMRTRKRRRVSHCVCVCANVCTNDSTRRRPRMHSCVFIQQCPSRESTGASTSLGIATACLPVATGAAATWCATCTCYLPHTHMAVEAPTHDEHARGIAGAGKNGTGSKPKRMAKGAQAALFFFSPVVVLLWLPLVLFLALPAVVGSLPPPPPPPPPQQPTSSTSSRTMAATQRPLLWV